MNSPEKEHFLKIYRDMLEFKDGFDNGVGREYAEYRAYIEHEQEEYEIGNRQGWENMQTFSEFFLELIRPIYKKIDDWLSVLSATQQKEEVIALRTQINYYIGLSEKYTLTKQVSTGKRYERYFIYFKANLPNIIWVVIFGKKLKNVKFLPFEGFLHGSLFLYQIKVISCICHEVPKEINGIKKQTTITALLNKEHPVIKKSLEIISERLAKYLYEELPVLGADSSSSNNEELITGTRVLVPYTNQETKTDKLSFSISKTELGVLFLALRGCGIISKYTNDSQLATFLESYTECDNNKEVKGMKVLISQIRRGEKGTESFTKVKQKLDSITLPVKEVD